jgi:hypothetical protein
VSAPDKVLARRGQKEGTALYRERVEPAQDGDRLRGGLREIRPWVEHDLLECYASR